MCLMKSRALSLHNQQPVPNIKNEDFSRLMRCLERNWIIDDQKKGILLGNADLEGIKGKRLMGALDGGSLNAEKKINNLNLELEKVVKERDELKLKIEKWEESSKNLDELLNSQMSARDKTGLGYGTQLNEMSNNSKTNSEISLSVFDVRYSDEESTPANDKFSKADGYHAVPPPITGNFLTPRADCKFRLICHQEENN
ncbi:hypothetical protein Tco_1221299 [Tanacetum coccineum]